MAKNVLVVDDSPTMRNMLKAAMQEQGFEVTMAEDGVDALKVVAKQKWDIIITDINMPNMDGIELIRELRQIETCKFTPILVITTEGGDTAKKAGKDAGASGWMVKPFNPDTLTKAVQKLCA
ncbi:MAG: response regulator [Proteobacteria bacterium]|nr:response regulator [Pseudomonadota bacterium]